MNQSKSSSTMFNKTAMKSTQINPESAQRNIPDKQALDFNIDQALHHFCSNHRWKNPFLCEGSSKTGLIGSI